MIEKKDKKIAKKGKETQKEAKKMQNKAMEIEKKVKKSKVTKVATKKAIKVEKDKKTTKKPKELGKKSQEAKNKAQEEMRKRAQEEEKKFREAEKRIREAEKKAREAEISRVQQAEKKAQDAEILRIQQAENKVREAEIKRVQEEKKKAIEVATKTKEEMKIMEEEKKPMDDEKKAKKVKVEAKKEEKKPVEEQRASIEAPIEAPTDFSAPKNNNGRTAVFISLIALAVAFFNFFTPPAPAPVPTKDIDLGGIQDNIDAVSSSVKNLKSKVAENRKLLDSQIASSAEKFEEQKAEADKMYLASGFTDLVKEIQPSLGIYCKRASVKYLKLAKSAKAGSNTVAVDCTFDNNGTLKANIIPGSLIMIGGKGQKVIDNAVERIDNGEATTILPGTSSGKQYHVVLTEAGTSNMNGGVLKMSFQAYTDKAALGMIKRKTHKEISEEQLKELTKKNHMFSFLL